MMLIPANEMKTRAEDGLESADSHGALGTDYSKLLI